MAMFFPITPTRKCVNRIVVMKNFNSIGLDAEKVAELSIHLNTLLANLQIYYQNLRGLHWNIKGTSFFELHLKFEELYTEANIRIDEVAERVLTLGGTPLHTFSDFISHAEIKERKHVSEAREAVALIIENLRTLLLVERRAITLAAEIGDEGTDSLLSDLITAQEKNVWMLSAWLKQ